jgi:hypothetical protein
MMYQRELPGDMALEIGYEGNHQAHQLILGNTSTFTNIGTTDPSATADGRRYITGIPAGCVGCGSVGNGLLMVTSNGFGNYAAGSAKLEKRFSRGLQFLTSYTWAHAMANAGTPLSGSSNFGFPDNTNWASGYSSAAWDIRHSLTTSFNYDIPFGKGKQYGGNMPRALDLIAGSWHVNGLLTLRTGVTYTLNGQSCQGVWSRCMPDILPGAEANQAPKNGRTPEQWFDISVYKVAAPLTGGNMPIQNMNGPPTKTFDFSTFKDFNVTERFRLQFRGEAFNLFNHPVFNNPGMNINDSKAVNPNNNGNFGLITGTQNGTERRMQFSLRMSF